MANSKIMVVDDDSNICELLRLYLEKEGYDTILAENGTQALEKFDREKPDLILLDIMMPQLDGWQVCREIRKKSSCPIIMLTAKGEVFDKVLGLELGADDYVTKPFSVKELAARTRAVIRRQEYLSAPQEEVLSAGGLTVDYARRRVTKNGQEIELTQREFELLYTLMKTPGRVFTREMLLDTVWKVDFYGDTRTVDVHVRYLRQKLEDEPDNPKRILTVRGVGYRFTDEP